MDGLIYFGNGEQYIVLSRENEVTHETEYRNLYLRPSEEGEQIATLRFRMTPARAVKKYANTEAMSLITEEVGTRAAAGFTIEEIKDIDETTGEFTIVATTDYDYVSAEKAGKTQMVALHVDGSALSEGESNDFETDFTSAFIGTAYAKAGIQIPATNFVLARADAENEGEYVEYTDEVTLATALAQVRNTPKPAKQEMALEGVDVAGIRRVIDGIKENGYIAPQKVRELLTCAGIPMVPEFVSADKEELIAEAEKMGYPIVAKVVGPVHKSDVGGVTLNIRSKEHLASEFDRMMQIKDANSVMIQKMISGMELFIGAKYEDRFGHIVLCGLGGIFVEALKDVSSGLAPLTMPEAESMIRSLRGYKILQGTRGQKGINQQRYAEIIVRLSTLLRHATEIKEMDLNPLLAEGDNVTAVDARILIEK